MGVILKKLAQEAGIEYEKVLKCRADFVKGIYEAHMAIKNDEETKDSLKRIINFPFNK